MIVLGLVWKFCHDEPALRLSCSSDSQYISVCSMMTCSGTFKRKYFVHRRGRNPNALRACHHHVQAAHEIVFNRSSTSNLSKPPQSDLQQQIDKPRPQHHQPFHHPYGSNCISRPDLVCPPIRSTSMVWRDCGGLSSCIRKIQLF